MLIGTSTQAGAFTEAIVKSMAAHVDRCTEIDPARCRESARRFAPETVAAGYEAVYDGVLAATAA